MELGQQSTIILLKNISAHTSMEMSMVCKLFSMNVKTCYFLLLGMKFNTNHGFVEEVYEMKNGRKFGKATIIHDA